MIAVTKLENGIRVVTEQMPGSRSVAVGIMVKAGPRDEAGDKAGLAHLVEHALFHGTSSRDSSDIARMIDTMGGRVAAFTGRDYTCFSAAVMDDHRTYVLDLLSDILLNSIFPEEKLENEKQVIVSEHEMEKDQPADLALSLLKKAMWGEQPLGRSIEGEPESIHRLTREDVIYFLHTNYLPNRLIIAVAGNLEHEDIVAQVRDCFWRLAGSADSTAPGSTCFDGGFVRQHQAGSQAYFAVGIEAPPYMDEDRYSVHLFNTVLGGGLSSRLFRSLREQRGLVYDVHSEYHAYMDGGALIVSGSAQPDSVFFVVDEVLEIVGRMATSTDPVTEEELWQAKLYNIGQYHIDSEDPYTRMSRLLTQHFYFSRALTAPEIIKGLEDVTTKSIADVCGRLFSGYSEKLAASVVGPIHNQ